MIFESVTEAPFPIREFLDVKISHDGRTPPLPPSCPLGGMRARPMTRGSAAVGSARGRGRSTTDGDREAVQTGATDAPHPRGLGPGLAVRSRAGPSRRRSG